MGAPGPRLGSRNLFLDFGADISNHHGIGLVLFPANGTHICR